MNIRYLGFWNTTGYGYAAMTNVTALKRAGHKVNIRVIDTAEFIVPADEFDQQPDVVVMHLQPHNWSGLRVPGALNVGYTTWEADRLPLEWIRELNQVDQVWVPSKWNKDVFEGSGVKVPVHVIPHHVRCPSGKNLLREDWPYRFYTIATAHVRKNLDGLLRAFKLVNKQYPDAELWVKTCGPEVEKYKKQFGQHHVQKQIRWIDGILSDKEIQDIHSSCDCFVSLNTGEGFGVPIADAMANGNEVITTGFGGQLDFSEGYARLVNYKLGPVSEVMKDHGFDRTMRDAKADIKHASQLMVDAYESQDLSKERGKMVRNHIQKHSYESIGARMTKAMNDRNITLKFLDNGIGDMICFLYAYEGFKKLHASMNVNVLWKKEKQEWHQALSRLIEYDGGFGIGKVIEIQLNSKEGFSKRINSDRGYRQQYADFLHCDPCTPQLNSFGKQVVIFPSAAWEDRIWPTDRFGELANRLSEMGYEVSFCDVDSNRTPNGYKNLKLSPDEVIKLVKRSSLVICNESGMAHLAGLLETSCICISGYQPKWRAHDMNNVIVVNGSGLDSITVDRVLKQALEILAPVVAGTEKNSHTKSRKKRNKWIDTDVRMSSVVKTTIQDMNSMFTFK